MSDPDPSASAHVPLAGRRCPRCGKPAVHGYRPFCSKRCADLDLGKWLSEDYRIAAEEAPGENDYAEIEEEPTS
ncbi:DNA gyrase inhibitor YacG [Magnetospira thiophila]